MSLVRVTTPSTTLQRPLEDEREVDHMKLEMKPPNTGELWEQATQKVLALGARASSALSHRLPDRAAPRHDLARPALTLVRAKCMREWISPRGNCIMNMSENAGARLRGAASRKTRGYRRCAGMASCTRTAEPEQPTDTITKLLLLAQHIIGGRSQHVADRYMCAPHGSWERGDVPAYRLLQCASRPAGSSGVGMTTLQGTRIRPIVFF